MDRPRAFDRRQATLEYRRKMPHLRQPGVIYFVTFRLGDSLPVARLKQWQEELELLRLTNNDLALELARRVERWLDLGHGACYLAQTGAAEVVRDALGFFDGDRYLLDEYVVMPNHMHALVQPAPSFTLDQITHSWKSFTSNQINRFLARRGRLWHSESFDHIVRNEQALRRFRRYIRENPLKTPHCRTLAGRGKLAGVLAENPW